MPLQPPINYRLIILWFIGVMPLHAQKDTHSHMDMMEKWIENTDVQADFNDLTDALITMDKKLDLNKATYEDLAMWPFLSHNHIIRILEHRQKYGPFSHPNELMAISHLPEQVVHQLLSIATVNPKINQILSQLNDIDKPIEQHINLVGKRRVQLSDGFLSPHDTIPPSFAGDPLHLIWRYRGSYTPHIQWGFTAEKDPGEPYFSSHQPYGFDFMTGYVWWNSSSSSNIPTIIAGDFQATFGQGLTYGTGMIPGKSAMVLQTKRNRNGFRPSHSLNENDYLRGIGISYRHHFLHFHAFTAVQSMSGQPLEMDSTGVTFVTNLNGTGLHRTPMEIHRKHTLQRTCKGLHIGYDRQGIQMGWTGVLNRLSHPVIPSTTQPHTHYYFRGKELLNQGIHYRYQKGVAIFFGEVSTNHGLQHASMIHGMLMSLGQKVDITIVHRHYHPAYHTAYSTAFSTYQKPQNEIGTYAGWTIKPHPLITMNSYIDFYRSPWLRYRILGPSYAADMLTEVVYARKKRGTYSIRWRAVHSELNETGSAISRIARQQRHQLRMQAEFQLTEECHVKWRWEWITHQGNQLKQHGFMAFMENKLQLYAKHQLIWRYTIFQVDAFAARVFVFEPNLQYTYTIQSLMERGNRIIMVYKWNIGQRWSVRLRGAHTAYVAPRQTGSGPDNIRSRYFTDLSMQLHARF